MSHVHVRPEHRADHDPSRAGVGTPTHFAAFARTQGVRELSARTYLRIERFVVPADGAWMINGLWVPPGTERVLEEGDVVRYHPVRRAPGDDRPRERVAVSTEAPNALTPDPEHLRFLRR